MNALYQFFLDSYENQPSLIRAKAKVLLTINLVAILLVFFSLIFVEIMIIKRAITISIDIFWIGLLSLTLLLLRRGKYRSAVSITIVTSFAALTGLGFLSANGTPLFYLTKVAYLLTPGIILTCLISTGARAPVLATIYSLFAVSVYFFFIFPVKLGTAAIPYHYSWFSNIVFILIAIGFIASLTTSIYIKAIKLAEEEASAKNKHLKDLQLAEEKFRTIFDSVDEAIFIHDPETLQVLDVNNKTLEMYQYSKEDALHFDLSRGSSNTPPYTLKEALEKISLAKKGFPQVFEWHARNSKNELFWVEINMRSVNILGQQRILVSARDISEKKQTESQRVLLEQRLRQSEKMDAIGQLAGGVAHDFNNQLTGILGFSELIINENPSQESTNFAEMIRLAALRSADLTKQLLAFARKGNFQKSYIDIHSIISETITLLSHSIDKRINIQQSLKAVPSIIMGDPTQFQNAFLNLSLNARDSMPQGGAISFETSIIAYDKGTQSLHSEFLKTGEYLEIKVSDTGSGMTPEILNRIYEPFFTTKSPGQGTGLGLSAVYGTIRSHEGWITCDSEPGKGTCFTIRLPIAKGDVAENTKELDRAPELKKMNILLIDDEDIVRALTKNMLIKFGQDVLIAHDGKTGIDVFSKHHTSIDLVILDMIMPDMNGKEVFDALKKIEPAVKVILISGYSLNTDTQDLLNSGAVDFLQKPFQLNALKESLSSFNRTLKS